MRLLRAFLVLSLLLLPQMANAETLMMAPTTSTQDTGLLEYLQPIFKKDTGIDLKWISVGTGKALAHGKDCDVDVLLVHAPALEEKFVADGFGVDRHQVMYNDFVLIGPAADPAGVKGKDIPTALKTFAEKKIPFVSRGDNSGTHNTEKQLWKVAGMEVPGKDATWYIDAGHPHRRRKRRLHRDRPRHLHQVQCRRQGRCAPEDPRRRRQGPPEPVQRHDGQPRQVPKGQAGSRQEVHQLVDQPQYPEGHRQLPA